MISKISRETARKLRPDSPYHLPPGAQSLNTRVELTLEDATDTPEIVLTDMRRDYTWHVAMEPDASAKNTWRAEIMLPMHPTIISYYFVVDGEEIYERRQIEGENIPIYGQWHELAFKIPVYDPYRMPAAWTNGMVVYQIFPDRFAKAQSDEQAQAAMNGVYGHAPKFMSWGDIPEAPPLGRDFYGGDLRGVIDKLDYLAELGVECIYFNPIFEASSNHRYEAVDFMKIDAMLGTEADFDALIEAAHERNIKIVLDAVFNHCSTDSIYFDINGKFDPPGAAQSRQSPYYRWFKFTQWPDTFDGWMDLGFMPEFVECPEMEAYFLGEDGVTAYWLDKGIDGWRCDVAFDNTDEFWRRFRDRVDATKPGAWLISEEWRDSSHYLLGDTFNATMNYRFTWAARGFLATDDLKPSELDDRLQKLILDTPPDALHAQMNLLDSHDTDRVLTACNGDRARYKQLVAFLLAYPGAPTIYYGDETGLEGGNAEDGRRCMPWDDIDADLYDYFKRTISAHKASHALRRGDFESVLIDDEQNVYAFGRRTRDEVVYAVFNASAKTASVTVPVDADGVYADLLGSSPDVRAADGALSLELGPRAGVWYSRTD